MKGLILSGGKGARLRPLTHTGAKQTIPVANKPILCYIIEDLVASGITDIGVVVGYTPERVANIKEAIGDAKRYGGGVKITYIGQDAPRGIAHAVACARDFISGEPFVVYLGDNMLEHGIGNFVREFSSGHFDAGILLCKVPNPSVYGVAEVDGKGRLAGVEEKPKSPKSDLAIVGVYLFTECVFDAIAKLKPSARGELEITHAIEGLISGKRKIMAHVVRGWWDDTGTPEAILAVNRRMLEERMEPKIEGNLEKGALVEGKVSIGKGTMVSGGARIRGPCIIGSGCKIGPDASIGPYTSIGDRCELESVKISNSLVLPDCRLNAKCEIRDSLIGKSTSILKNSGKHSRIIVGENSYLEL